MSLQNLSNSELLLLRQYIEALDANVIISKTDFSGEITYANEQFVKISGYSLDELVGKHHRIIKSGLHSPEFYSQMWKQIRAGLVWRGEVCNKAKNGQLYWVDSVIHPIKDQTGAIVEFFSFRTDITERKMREEQQKNMLIQQSKMSSLGESTSGIAHEIMNPLTIIVNYATLIKRNLEKDHFDVKAQIQMAEKIEATAHRISKIVKALKTFTRNAEADPFEEVGLSQLFADTLEICREGIQSHGIQLAVDAPAELKVQCRPAQIVQVLVNLIMNSVDALSEGSEQKWIKIQAQETENQVEIGIEDSGPGISDEVAEKIMQPFFTTKKAGKGTGLGLSISRSILKAHGGSLELDRRSKTTRFVIRLSQKTSVESLGPTGKSA